MREIKALKERLDASERKSRSVTRKNQRLVSKLKERLVVKGKREQRRRQQQQEKWSPCANSTPRSQTKSLLKSLNVRPSDQNKKARKQLVYLHSVDNSVRLAASANSDTKGTVIGLLSASMDSSRQQVSFSSSLLSHHRRIAAVTETTRELPQKRREPERRAVVVGLVVDYLSRDEQSRMNPGKRDCVTINGEKVQTRVCTDYVGTLYNRFQAEYPLEKVGRSTFFSSRPAHILKSSSLQAFGCLCQTHENTSLLLKALKPLVPSQVSVSPDTFCDRFPDSASVSGLVAEEAERLPADHIFAPANGLCGELCMLQWYTECPV